MPQYAQALPSHCSKQELEAPALRSQTQPAPPQELRLCYIYTPSPSPSLLRARCHLMLDFSSPFSKPTEQPHPHLPADSPRAENTPEPSDWHSLQSAALHRANWVSQVQTPLGPSLTTRPPWTPSPSQPCHASQTNPSTIHTAAPSAGNAAGAQAHGSQWLLPAPGEQR